LISSPLSSLLLYNGGTTQPQHPVKFPTAHLAAVLSVRNGLDKNKNLQFPRPASNIAK
jgi:hypothetical protein